MIHLGDITAINGREIPVVDCVIGGSPCQDLSVAGLRAGLAGERSGLYMHQIRVIKEMREQDVLRGRTGVDVRPRYMVWENVPGAFSTNGGKDFAAVIEEAIRVVEPQAPPVPVPAKGWPTSGVLFDECGRWSVAWRVLDAQFWGTPDKPLPQRRRRIALIADFGGLSAPEILFVRDSVSGDIEPSEPKRKETSQNVGECADRTIGAVGFPLGFRPENVKCYEETATTLCNGTRPGFTTGVIALQGAGQTSQRANGSGFAEDVIYTLNATDVHGVAYCIGNGKADNLGLCEKEIVSLCYGMDNERRRGPDELVGISPALTARAGTGGGNVPCVIQGFDAYNQKVIGNVAKTLTGTSTDADHIPVVVKGPSGVQAKHIVRRLTPLECERLQGFPDGWTDIGEWIDSKGKKHKEADSPRYKALGNSIAIPPWKWVLKRLCACYERDATMGSLFDGIGGFPYIWEQLNGKGSCLWASEIEEFPMAVTKRRFGE